MTHSPLPFYVGTRPEVDVDEVIQTGARSFSYTGGYTGNDEYDREWGVFCIIDNEPEVLAQPWNQADAEFIVRACNSHDDLLTACESARLILESQDTMFAPAIRDRAIEVLENINRAIGKARGEK